MTKTTTPASNPGSPSVFGTGSAFGSESRPQSALPESRRKRTPRLHSPDNHSSDSIPNPTGSFVRSRLSPSALNPCRLETPADSTSQPFNVSPMSSPRLGLNTAGYVRLFEAMCTYVRLFDPFWRKNYSQLVKKQQPKPSLLRWGETPGEPP